MSVEMARAEYVYLSDTLPRHVMYCQGSWRSRCHQWMSLRVDAASIALDNATALHWAGRRPSFAVRAAGDLV